ncbi:MAG: GGDEF domain-containing protein, partial [Betaproteobacteria bacterium]|nr:GGDEF domain-containing protein [Betaproteobacteria bacterium]
MASPSSPAEIASKTLKTLVSRKLAPTPENYARIYAEVSGKPLEAPAAGQPQEAAAAARPTQAWSALIRDLMRQLEAHHKGITLSRKKDGLDVVLTKFSGNPEALYDKLHALLRSWGSAGAPTSATPAVTEAAGSREPELGNLAQAAAMPAGAAATAQPQAPGEGPADHEMMGNLKELLAQSLESGLTLQQDLAGEIQDLAQQVRSVADQGQLIELAKKLRHFWVKLELRGGDKAKIQEGLLRLLRLLVENVGELVADDKWLHGQIAVLQAIIAQPLDKRSITDAERNLRDALIKQSTLKKSLTDAKATLKSLMTTFIDRMGELTESTGEYHAKMEAYNLKIGQADNLTELGHILEDIMQ